MEGDCWVALERRVIVGFALEPGRDTLCESGRTDRLGGRLVEGGGTVIMVTY